ncbi:MAG: PEP-CTERM sorting domain-containing protein [Leptolyngbya sp. Prado105]|jgi:hypothetical protein|nr:PEP-CTERM sorting domain-containing protein [Leptolyngbya sp. Prado105]
MPKRPPGLIRPRSTVCLASVTKSASCSVSADTQGITAEPAPKHALKRSFTLITLGITGGWLFSNLWLPARAATMINNSGLEFDQDTTLDSNFVESHGAYQSTFGVLDLTTRKKTPLITETKPSDNAESIFKPSSRRSHIGTDVDFQGTPGNAVANPTAQFTFKANKRYVLYLESSFNGRPTGILYSSDVLNPNREQQVKFAGAATDLCTSGVMVNWDDTGSKLVRNRKQQDRDFDDFIVQLKGTTCAIGGGELPPIVSQVPPPPSVGKLPPQTARGRFPWAALLPFGAIPFIRSGGGSRSNPPTLIGGGGSIPPTLIGGGGSTPPTNKPPKEAVPEPITMLGTGSAIAFGALMQRRRKRKR